MNYAPMDVNLDALRAWPPLPDQPGEVSANGYARDIILEKPMFLTAGDSISFQPVIRYKKD